MVARRIEQADRGVRQADIGVHQDRLRATRGKEIAVCHAHRGVLMWRDDRLRQGRARIAMRPRHTFDDRRKISTGIDEYVVDAKGPKAPQQRFSGGDIGLPIVHAGIFGWA